MVRSGVQLIVFDGGKVVEWDLAAEPEPELEVMPEPEPELEPVDDRPRPRGGRRRRSFLSHVRRAA